MNKKNTALITGAAKRIGREIALSLAESGCDVVISYNNSALEAENLKSEIIKKFSVNCEIFPCDLRDENQVKNLAEFMINFPNWNLLINNASIFNKSRLLDTTDSELLDNFNVHLFSPLILIKKFAKNIKEKNIKNSQIINILDKSITSNKTSYFYYLLSKKSLADLTKMLAIELAPQTRVNGIAPGFILLPENSDLNEDILIEKIPLKKQGAIKNITQTVNFLLENDFISGEILFVDGGASM